MPAERRRTVRGDATQNLLLSRRQRVGSAMILAVKPHHVGDLEPRPPDVHGRCSAEDLSGGCTDQVERVACPDDVIDADVRIPLGRLQRTVTE